VPEKQNQSRLEQYQKNGTEIEMPPLKAVHLVAYLFEIGPTFSGGMGSVGLPFTEIESWQRQTGYELQSWEVSAIRRASIEYASQSYLATKVDCPPPWIGEVYAENVSQKVSRIFKSLVKH
jgi:hypothetical protein